MIAPSSQLPALHGPHSLPDFCLQEYLCITIPALPLFLLLQPPCFSLEISLNACACAWCPTTALSSKDLCPNTWLRGSGSFTFGVAQGQVVLRVPRLLCTAATAYLCHFLLLPFISNVPSAFDISCKTSMHSSHRCAHTSQMFSLQSCEKKERFINALWLSE